MTDAVSGSTGGNAFFGKGIVGGPGGDAHASINLTGFTDVAAQAQATGGNGGSVQDGGNAGHGGAATLGAVLATSNGGGNVDVEGLAIGGSGGRGSAFAHTSAASGGDGTSVSLTDIVDGSTTGGLLLSQGARGGSGGAATGDGTVGVAGSALSSLSRSKSSSSLLVRMEAFGGNGGDLTSASGTSGNGATAISISSAINDAGSAPAKASATGGFGGSGQAGASGGAGGQANATAFAATTGGFVATAIAEVRGGSGQQGNLHGSALAHAQSNGVSGTASTLAQSGDGSEAAGGIVRQITTSATAPVTSTSITESRAAVSEPTADRPSATGLQSAAFATALPTANEVQAALIDNPNVNRNLGVGGISDVLGLVVLGGAYSNNGSGTSLTYTSRADFDLDMTPLLGNSHDLLVGLLDTTTLGLGFDTLNFQIGP